MDGQLHPLLMKEIERERMSPESLNFLGRMIFGDEPIELPQDEVKTKILSWNDSGEDDSERRMFEQETC